MTSEVTSEDDASKLAPRYLVPDRVAMTVEHPCIVKNVDKAMDMIGGSSAVAKSQAIGAGASLHLSFRPDDPSSRPVASIHRKTNNVLLQVTVPKRTGRKRKRGSNGPFVEEPPNQGTPKDAAYLLRSLQDNPESYSVEPLATVPSAHVWRGMPDFVYSTAQSDFVNNIREMVLPGSYPLMKQYRFPQTYGLANTEVVPPSQLSSQTIPTNYSYRANPQIPTFTDPVTGEQSLYHLKDARKNHQLSIHWYNEIPTRPAVQLPHLSTKSPEFQSVVKVLRDLFTDRPIWTRRALINKMSSTVSLQTARSALAYVAFTFRSGPWRDTVCSIGVDPRSDPKHRVYQSVMIQAAKKVGRGESLENDSGGIDDENKNSWTTAQNWKRSENPTSHIFTGTGDVPLDGKIWQVCDVVDPQLRSVVELEESVVELSCERRTRGFYPAGAWAKLKAALKYKIEALQTRQVDAYSQGIDRLLMLPDVWDGEGSETDAIAGRMVGGYLPADFQGKEMHWAAMWRASVRRMMQEERMAVQQGKGKGKGKSVRFVDDGMEDVSSEMDTSHNAHEGSTEPEDDVASEGDER